MPFEPTLLIGVVGKPLFKAMASAYLADDGLLVGDMAADVLDIVKNKLDNEFAQSGAVRFFDAASEQIVKALFKRFEEEVDRDNFNKEAIAEELGKTIAQESLYGLLLGTDREAKTIVAALKKGRPLPPEIKFNQAEVDFYDEALDLAVGYLSSVLGKLPKFEEKVFLRMLDCQSDTLRMLQEVLDNQSEMQAHLGASEDDSGETFEVIYRRAVRQSLDFMELLGVDKVSLEAKEHALSVAYVSLSLGDPDQDGSGRISTEEALLALKPGQGRLLVKGEAGSGKSTLFRWMAIQAAKGLPVGGTDYITDPANVAVEMRQYFLANHMPFVKIVEPTYGRGPRLEDGLVETALYGYTLFQFWYFKVPFFIRLRNCETGVLPPLSEFHLATAQNLREPPKNWTANILEQGRGIVLLDGVDEVPDTRRDKLRREINDLVERYPDNYYVVSSRPGGVSAGWLGPSGFSEAEVTDMTQADKMVFIDKWHDAVGASCSHNEKERDRLPGLARALKQQLKESPTVSRLARFPLLCAAICALHKDHGKTLPTDEADLCDAICNMLLHKREGRTDDLQLDAFPEVYTALKDKEKRAIVRNLAHYMVREGKSTLSRDITLDRLKESLGVLTQQSEEDAPALLDTLIARSGVLRLAMPDWIDFIHNALKEYLAAEAFAEEAAVQPLVDRYKDEMWARVIVFAAAGDKQKYATELIEALLNTAPDARPSEVRARRLLAIQCNGVTTSLAPALQGRLKAVEKTLFPPRTMAEATALADGGDGVVSYLSYRQKLTVSQTRACIRTLRLIGTPKAQRTLEGYLKDTRKGLVEEIAQAVEPLHSAAVRALFLRVGKIPEVVRKNITDLTPLSGLTGLQNLHLSYTSVSDLAPLSGLTGLQMLYLSGTLVSDLSALSGLTGLQSLFLHGTKVSDVSPVSQIEGLDILGP